MTKKQHNKLSKTLFVSTCMRIVLIFCILLSFWACKEKQEPKPRVLPFIGNYDLEYSTIDGKENIDTIYPKIPDFSFLNQDSIKVTSSTFKGKIWIADFFFTSCSTICPGMTATMKKLNDATQDLADHIQFLSFSIDPKTDQPNVLKAYRKNYNISSKNWVFLTGNEDETHRLGVENFYIHAAEDENATDGYAHAEAFSLVDKEGYVRGVYNMAQAGELERIEKDLRKLLKEEYGIVGSK
jgi:protein SCO1/2